MHDNLEDPVGFHPWLRRAVLAVIGLAPFVLFFSLLPPSDGTPDLDSPGQVASFQEPVPLAFPFPQDSPSPVVAEAPAPSAPPAAPERPQPSPAPTKTPPRSVLDIFRPGCSNGVDDDGEGGADMADPGCQSPTDWTEFDNPRGAMPAPAANDPPSGGALDQDGLPPDGADGDGDSDPPSSGEPDPLDEGFLEDFPS